ncbi:MAG: lysylphosphatidylglycerol synthase transmembrane domain-containing protein [Candidatus Latescibacterota bacterium]
MAGRLKTAAQYLLSLVLMGGFLYWAFRNVDAAALGESLRSTSLFWAGALVVTALCTLVIRAWRWTVLMRSFPPQVTIRDASLALAICYAANVVIPRSGEALRAVSLKWTRGVTLSTALATVLLERILDIVFLLIFLGASFLLVRERIEAAFPWMATLSVLAFAICLALLAALAAVSLYQDRAVALIVRLLGRVWPGAATRAGALLGTFLEGLHALRSPAAYLEIAVGSVLLNIGYVLIIYEGFLAFDFDGVYALGLDAALVLMALSSFGVIFPTPGAAGSYHLFFSKSLVALYAVPQSAALACATAVHAIATVTYLTLGGPALLWQRRRRRVEPTTAVDQESQPPP